VADGGQRPVSADGGQRTVVRNQEINHEVVAAQSPRLLYSATLGASSDDPPNPDGVVAVLQMKKQLSSINDNDLRRSDPPST